MILLRIMGGLGNQMFQFSTGYSLAKKNNTILKIDTTLLMDRSRPHEIVTHRTLLLNEVFNIKVIHATKVEVEKFNGKLYKNIIGKIYNKIIMFINQERLAIESTRSFDKKFTELEDNTCVVGSFQSELYFKNYENDIRKLFTFRNQILPQSIEIYNTIISSESVAIHIRRGDYITSPIYNEVIGVLEEDYYSEAIKLINNKISSPIFFVFSDDINWCKAAFEKYRLPMIYVEDEHAGEYAANYLQLMSLCKHFIISNSTYAWWGAWLSKNESKTIIAPARWFKKEEYNKNNIVPENWIKI